MRDSANGHGLAYAVMYDLSGLNRGETHRVRADWERLRKEASITGDPAYLHHEDKPLVAIWGVWFNDRRRYTLDDCRELIQFLKDDGCAVMLGVPPTWASQGYDTIDDPGYLDVLKLADVISPWAQTYQPGDDKVTEGGMVVMATPGLWELIVLIKPIYDPFTCISIQRLIHPRYTCAIFLREIM